MASLAACSEDIAPTPQNPSIGEGVGARHVPLEGQPNFRDLGGYRTTDGRMLKWGEVYRSGELGQLTELKRLYLDNNELIQVPAELSKLTKLEWLYLGYNKLTSLPAWIGKLTKLVNFHIGFNMLTSMPSEIGQLTNLENLLGKSQIMNAVNAKFIANRLAFPVRPAALSRKTLC